ncbi:MAG: spore protease YyaC [Lachnospiraceae bacterium]
MRQKQQFHSSTYYFDSNQDNYYQFGELLYQKILAQKKENQEIILICIGTDRVTGDCLGPLVGHKLKHILPKDYILYGSLSHPVHALNLEKVVHSIYKQYKNPFFIVIDASLGDKEHIGYVTLSSSTLKPGQGVRKNLPAIGHISITGIVNFASEFSASTIQTTRLYTVMQLADYIYYGIVFGLSRTGSRTGDRHLS